jgi:hypothetical protein
VLKHLSNFVDRLSGQRGTLVGNLQTTYKKHRLMLRRYGLSSFPPPPTTLILAKSTRSMVPKTSSPPTSSPVLGANYPSSPLVQKRWYVTFLKPFSPSPIRYKHPALQCQSRIPSALVSDLGLCVIPGQHTTTTASYPWHICPC